MKVIIKNIIKNNFKLLQSNVNKVSRKTNIMYNNGKYDGYNHCGAMSYCTYNLLKTNYINTNVYISSYGSGKYMEDHVYLQLNNIIIDPTYKQFLRGNRNNEFNKILYDILDPVYVGSKKNLFNIYENLILLNNNNSDYKLDINDYIKFWNNSTNITIDYDNRLHLLNDL